MVKKCAAFIGRFQPFHKGHEKIIERHKDEELCIIIGSSNKSRTNDNPLSTDERKEIIKSCYPEINLYSVNDYKSDQKWIESILEKESIKKVISGNENVLSIAKEHVETKKIDMIDPELYSGTEVRRRIRSGGEWSYLVPKCAKNKIENYVDEIKSSGTQYEFEPGWERKNAYHNTSDE